MRNAPGVPLTIAELQLSSPLPSPSRQSVLNNSNSSDSDSNSPLHHHQQQRTPHRHTLSTNTIHNSSSSSSANISSHSTLTTSTTTIEPASNSTFKKTIIMPPVHFDFPHSLHPDLYPLANAATPSAMRKFTFSIDGKSSTFEEVHNVNTNTTTTTTTTARKRSASVWDDDRSFKRTELDTNTNINNNNNNNNNNNEAPDINLALSSIPPASPPVDNTTIVPDSPNSALPSPVSDLDEMFYTEVEQQDRDDERMSTDDPMQVIEDDDDNNNITTTMDPSNLIDTFDMLPDSIQTYFMFQLLKRSPRHALRLANATIMQVLRLDILMKLPQKVAVQILGHLDVRSLCRASSVNKAWKNLIDTTSSVWELKMQEADFKLSPRERLQCTEAVLQGQNPFKKMVRRHTIMRRNWKLNRHHKLVLEGHEKDLVACLQFDDEKIITTGSDDHRINVYDIKTGELKRVLKGHDGGVWALQYVGNTLVTGSIDRTVRVWDIERGVCRFVLRGHSSTVRCLKIVMPENIVQPDGSVRLEPKEPIIVSGSRDMTIRVWKLPNLETEPELPLSTSLEDDFLSNEFLKFKLVEHEHSVRDLAVHGNTLVSGSYDNNVIVWNLETGEKSHILKGHTMRVYCVAIDPKRRHCISGSLDASVRIWGLDDGECKFVLQGHSILVGLLGLVDDTLVSAAADATLRIWDPATGDRLHILAGNSGHQSPITSFQHDKHKIISGSEGGVKMWDTQTGELLHDLVEGASSIWQVLFDERRCIAAVKNENETQLVVLDFGIHGLEGEDN